MPIVLISKLKFQLLCALSQDFYMKQPSTSLPQFLKNAVQNQEKKSLTGCNYRTMIRYLLKI